MEKLIKKVERWSIERGLNVADPGKQRMKFWEEFGELNSSIVRNDKDGVIDAIGDMMVVMIIYCQQMGFDSKELFEDKVNKNNFSRSLDTCLWLDFVAQEFLHAIHSIRYIRSIIVDLQVIAERYDTNLKDCLQSAYNIIKDRRGKMVNGVFIKEEDLK